MNNVETYLESRLPEMKSLLEQLVNIDSGSFHKEGVDKVGTLIRKQFEDLGMNVKVHRESKYGNHLEIMHDHDSQPKIIIIAHMDTVFPAGEVKKRPYKVIGNKAYGPGVSDEKASHVAVLFALKALKASGSDAYKNVHIIFNSDEEIGSPTSKAIIKEAAKQKDYSLVVESGRPNDGIVTERKGVGCFVFEVKGKSAHAGVEPESGRSAIEELAHKIIKLQKLNDYETGLSVNVGLIEGGISTNTIPSNATAHVDVRVKNMKQAEEITSKINEIAHEEYVSGTETKLSGKIDRPPMEKVEGTEELLHIIRSVGEELGMSIREVSSGGGSDASYTSTEGIPTVDGMGPLGEFSHSETNEYVDLSSLSKRTALLALTIERLSRAKQ
ncbi:M20 family metallopeptidase [Metabacillus sediminilitoris]|uniref:M20 family metallopeptidase n=1 Tax=Metabacillus sediminilitoris TaxID=2567941 RepID=A0A4S4BPI1_9BACI|nr:M20 family metallopeptidase [Metabacillus sediminilitoris]QGQ47666.1 M20/M25/M40 family metallo-hydrolase [Metabacillus sediminilitoris]THF76775.1 M20 family metallopeptidase [Metabacillus sediminilitoris]